MTRNFSSLVSVILVFLLVDAVACAGTQAASFDVRAYGAKGDGVTLDSSAINQAIKAAAEQGGGTVLITSGTYLSGSIRLKNNINLHLAKGAVLLGAPQEMNAYDETESFPLPAYQDGGHSYFRNSLIWGENLSNVSITGPGMINGGGLVENLEKLNKMVGFYYAKDLKQRPELATPNPNPQPNNGMPPIRTGNKAISLKLCKDVVIRDVTIYHGGWFAILATGCERMLIDQVTIDTNRDGMDIDCCRDVIVSNCRVNSPMDDGICLKSSVGLGEVRLTENVTITKCLVSGYEEGSFLDGTFKPFPQRGTGRIKFGTEASGGFRNITVTDCEFRDCFGLALQEVDAGIMENIRINNLKMTNVKHYAIHITTGKRNRRPSPTAPSLIRNVVISNVTAENVEEQCAIQLFGLPEQPLEGIRLENIRITSRGGGKKDDIKKIPPELGTDGPEASRWRLPAYGLFARHVKDLELINISLSLKSDDPRPVAMFSDINGMKITNVKAQAGSGAQTAQSLGDVRGVKVTNSPGFEELR